MMGMLRINGRDNLRCQRGNGRNRWCRWHNGGQYGGRDYGGGDEYQRRSLTILKRITGEAGDEEDH